ncbi:NAD-dependent epimerase/dehydratase family protein [Paenibacillus lentus]|uniref:SDR family NAD(P)-dependent oxidoreductase n=1 Tax=Paenibacillus lentus TaxID=1338368 RepID=A0A3Q8S690_9BACL|nr:SDR family NAD(P)-dependent oxidoreductase [Paenibacillus lentus]AZK48357.1 SDR family NAD(P)-dependent oxidoreductase [Paenibacillus lentus]
MSSSVILITGAGGFTGRHACRKLAEKGYRVAAVVRTRASLEAMPPISGVDYYVCDMNKPGQVQEVVQRVTPRYVLHLAGKNSVSESWANPVLYAESNIMATVHLLSALRRYKEVMILIAGSRLKFDLSLPVEPTHPYGLSKSIQEIVALAWGKLFQQRIILAEPSNLVGPGPSTGICSLLARHIAALERGEAKQSFRLSSAQATRDFLDVRDAVDAYELLLHQGVPGEVYPVCSGVERSLGEVCKSFISLARVECPFDEGTRGKHADELSAASIVQPEALMKLGWSPSIAWETSVGDILQYFRREDTNPI